MKPQAGGRTALRLLQLRSGAFNAEGYARDGSRTNGAHLDIRGTLKCGLKSEVHVRLLHYIFQVVQAPNEKGVTPRIGNRATASKYTL